MWESDPIVSQKRYTRNFPVTLGSTIPNMWLSMNTNAGARDEAWWTELAPSLGRMGAVIFSVDGPSDTNPVCTGKVLFGTM